MAGLSFVDYWWKIKRASVSQGWAFRIYFAPFAHISLDALPIAAL